MRKKLIVKHKGKKYLISDYKICKNVWSKIRGLMFRGKNYKKPLLFVFEKAGKHGIHSFFCKKFIGIWMLFHGNKIEVIDEKIVKPFKWCVVPEKKFNMLLEVPLRYFEFADEKAKV
jgi:uncharacterized membrane protein (UPF0127 family)